MGTPRADSTPVVDFDPSLLELREEIVASATSDIQLIAQRLTDVLEQAGVELKREAPSVPQREIDRHAFVRVRVGSGWETVSVTGATGTSFGVPEPGEQPEEIAADDMHTVTIRVLADFVQSGGITTDVILERTFPSQELVNVPIALVHLDSAASSTLGFNLGDILSGQERYTPAIVVGAEMEVGEVHLVFGGLGGVFDVFNEDPSGIQDGEPLAEYVEVIIASPGHPDQIVRRTLFDRIADLRNEPQPDFSFIEPIEMVEMFDGSHQFVPLSSLIALGVTTGAIPADAAAWPTSVDSELLPMLHAIYGINRTRQVYGNWDINQQSRFFIDRPNVHCHIHAPEADQSGKYTRGRLTADLIFTSGAGTSPDDSIPFGIIDGVVTQRAEQDSLDLRIFERFSDQYDLGLADTFAEATIGTFMGQALASATELDVISSQEELDSYSGSFDPLSARRIGDHLASGRILIVPAVSGVGEFASGWWVYDPVSGRIWDELQNGLSAAALIFSTTVEYTFQVKVALFAFKFALKKFLGNCIGSVASLAVDLIAVTPPYLSVGQIALYCS